MFLLFFSPRTRLKGASENDPDCQAGKQTPENASYGEKRRKDWIERSTEGAGNATVLNQKRGSTESVRQHGKRGLTTEEGKVRGEGDNFPPFANPCKMRLFSLS